MPAGATPSLLTDHAHNQTTAFDSSERLFTWEQLQKPQGFIGNDIECHK
jgi:hypothetical protein